jgi:hypothetical protein
MNGNNALIFKAQLIAWEPFVPRDGGYPRSNKMTRDNFVMMKELQC